MNVRAIGLGVGVFMLVVSMSRVTGQPPGRTGGMQKPMLSMEDMDADKDGNVTLDEFLEAHKKSLTQRFERMDRDHNRVLTKDEIENTDHPSPRGNFSLPKDRLPAEGQPNP